MSSRDRGLNQPRLSEGMKDTVGGFIVLGLPLIFLAVFHGVLIAELVQYVQWQNSLLPAWLTGSPGGKSPYDVAYMTAQVGFWGVYLLLAVSAGTAVWAVAKSREPESGRELEEEPWE